jgi:hypothetical protein
VDDQGPHVFNLINGCVTCSDIEHCALLSVWFHSFMIFCLPGLLMMNAAIIKHTASCASLSQMVSHHDKCSVAHKLRCQHQHHHGQAPTLMAACLKYHQMPADDWVESLQGLIVVGELTPYTECVSSAVLCYCAAAVLSSAGCW